MKKFAAIVLSVVMLVAVPVPAVSAEGAVPTPESPTWTPPNLMIARVSATDGSEFVQIHNTSATPVDVNQMEVRIFGTGEKPRATADFGSGTIAANGFVLLSQVEPTDKLLDSNNPLVQNGRVELWADEVMSSYVCWGTVSCPNRVAGSLDDGKALENNCLSSICTAETYTKKDAPPIIEYGGWTPFVALPNDPPIDEPDNPIDETPDPSAPLNLCTDFVISEIAANVDDQFIELYNHSTAPASLSGCWLEIEYGNTRKSIILPDEVVPADSYYAVAITQAATLAKSPSVDRAVRLLAEDNSEAAAATYGALAAGSAWALFADGWHSTPYPTPDAANSLSRVTGGGATNDCAGLIITEIAANYDNQFIEIMNSGASAVNLDGCQLRTNRNNNAYVFDSEVLSAGAYRVVTITDSPLTLTKTTTGTVYIVASDGLTEVAAVSYANLKAGTTWALVDGEWQQTYQATPGADNVWQAYPACQDGYERNLATGRCNKITEPDVLAPCPDGQYRSAETNRCRKLETASTLTPCQVGYERNPETNRCRKIATDGDELKPCQAGYERNPETNRCRKIASSGDAKYAVDASANDETVDGWFRYAGWGGLTAIAGMTGWQFRDEMRRSWRNLGNWFRKGGA
jgi:hypothetical protein